jgi:DNA-binding MarR family transcriptional regulator
MADATTPAEVADIPNRALVEQSVRFSRAFQRWLSRSRDGAIAYPRLMLLETLYCNGPARMRDLADELGLTARNLTTVADALETENLLRRAPHPTDRRATLLELTGAGRTAVERALGPQLLEISQLFDVLSASEKAKVLEALTTLSSAIEADENAGG